MIEAFNDSDLCSGCGILLPNPEFSTKSRYSSSAACWNLYGELTAYTLSNAGPDFLHQIVVDAYAAQHAGVSSPNISTAFALIGLCLVFESGYTGRQVQNAHRMLAARSKSWPSFSPQRLAKALTVKNVIDAEPGIRRDEMIRRYAKSVWEAWSDEHTRVKRVITKYFEPDKMI
ncbi:MAG: serine/threonine protein kinase [Ignavibacteriales bacterium]|nr:serine/threonine protein kinase [Ignavibacteriales bacterium]